jgi:signal peptidase I
LIPTLRVTRSAFRVAWFACLGSLIVLVALPTLLGLVGRQMYIVRGASMDPGIPLGAIVVVEHVDPALIASGDVVTFRIGSASVVTHRVLAVTGGSQLSFATKGDANQTADPVPVPGDAVIGRVDFDVPAVGFFLATLATTMGMVVVVAILASLLIGGWFIDDLVATLASSRRRGVVAEQRV